MSWWRVERGLLKVEVDSVSHHHLDGSTRTVGKVTMLQRGSAGDTPSQLLGRLPVPPWVD